MEYSLEKKKIELLLQSQIFWFLMTQMVKPEKKISIKIKKQLFFMSSLYLPQPSHHSKQGRQLASMKLCQSSLYCASPPFVVL